MRGHFAYELPGVVSLSQRSEQGYITFMPDYMGEQDGGGLPAESMSPWGLVSRPRDPIVSATGLPIDGALLFWGFAGDKPYGWAGQDPRYAALVPDPQKGGTVVYGVTEASAVSSVLIDGTTGDITVSAKLGQSVVLAASTGDITITHPGGPSITVRAAEVELGGSGAKFLLTQDILTWITSTLLPALAAASIPVAPPVGVLTTTTKGL